MKEKKIKSVRGITLIALIVTIVVLLILAGVSINAIFNDNGIIKKAQEAQSKMNEAKENDEKGINDLNNLIDNFTNGGTTTNEEGAEEVSVENGVVAVTTATSTKLYTNLSGVSKILEDGSKVKLLKNSTENTNIEFTAKNITLDWDGKTLSGTGKLVNNGEGLTINNGIINVSIENNKTLTIYGGTFNGDINATSDGIVRIYSGTFNGDINVTSDGEVRIYGGTFVNDVSQYLGQDYEMIKSGDVYKVRGIGASI